ncbi:MAG: formylglycine-generating enzyme family protein [Bacteroidales bacterium]|nr:formylglycine-generating enzyme family protein [Bacteroidales bacterium]
MNKFSKLLLIVMLMCSVSMLCSVYATNYYIGFTDVTSSNHYTATNANLISVLSNANADDIVYIAKNCKFYLDSQLIVNTHIIGGCVPTGDGSQRTAIGAAGNLTDSMTVLDGNSLRHPLRSEKHRVATVNTNGIIENCLIRNGHARGTTNNNNDLNGHGGGVLLNGGKLYNCIIRGNVAMNVEHQSTTKSSGGGVYITNDGGQVVNCVIVFNMDDKGVGIDGVSGESINNTVAYNTQTPTWVNIPGGTFQPFTESPPDLTPNRYITLSDFYIASTECTTGQYACFMSAVEMFYTALYPPYLSYADRDSLVKAKAPVPVEYTGYPSGITVEQYAILAFGGGAYRGGSGTTIGGITDPGRYIWNILQSQTNVDYASLTAISSDLYARVWYPVYGGTAANTTSGEALRRDNYAMSYVSWWGSLAFSLWIGGCLPTEAQWEYAARHDGSIASTSNKYAGCNTDSTLANYAWYSDNASSRVHEVAKKLPTAKGLYDMSGNLWEWILDPYTSSYTANVAGSTTLAAGSNLLSSGSGTGASESPYLNPVAYPAGQQRVLRGGSWNGSATDCSLGYRSSGTPSIFQYGSSRTSGIGFRAVCVP